MANSTLVFTYFLQNLLLVIIFITHHSHMSTSTLPSQVIFTTPAKALEKKARQKEVEKMEVLAQKDTEPVFTCQSVFPFDLFPDRLTISSKKLSITQRYFFFERQTQSIMISDLLSIIIEESLLFASIHIVDRKFPQNVLDIDTLNKEEARRARRIVEGIIIAEREKIDFTKIPTHQLSDMLEKIGETKVS